jgi:hypothetical protein
MGHLARDSAEDRTATAGKASAARDRCTGTAAPEAIAPACSSIRCLIPKIEFAFHIYQSAVVKSTAVDCL